MENTRYFIELKGHGSGLGCQIIEVLTCLHFYELGIIKGLKIHLGENEYYYDPNHKGSWWDYYFEPLFVGEEGGPKKEFYFSAGIRNACAAEFFHSRRENFEIFNKYIKIKSHILRKVEEFVSSQFARDFIIGIHYRAVKDLKRYEAPSVPHEKALEDVADQVSLIKDANYKIFVATDDQVFLDKISVQFPNKVLSYDIVRYADNRPLYQDSSSPYRSGEDALIDCLLLSRANVLLRTSSNLSWVSSMLNPEIPDLAISSQFSKDIPPFEAFEEYKQAKRKAENGIPPYELLKWTGF